MLLRWLGLKVKKESDASGKVYEQGSEAQATSDSNINIADVLNLVKQRCSGYLPHFFELKESELPTAVATNDSPNVILGSSDGVNVAQHEGNVKHSLSDSDGIASVIAADKADQVRTVKLKFKEYTYTR